MTRAQLEHAIRAACDVANDTELIIFGSQAILGEYPDAPADLRASIEVDIQPRNRPEAVDKIDGALGELSLFHGTHGFYVQGVERAAQNELSGALGYMHAWAGKTVNVGVGCPRLLRHDRRIRLRILLDDIELHLGPIPYLVELQFVRHTKPSLHS
jgi:hypothetical protein